MKTFPSALDDGYHARELASMYRSDQIWVSSDYEKMTLAEKYNIVNTKILPFFIRKKKLMELKKNLKKITV